MTYLAFHAVFVLPPILLLSIVAVRLDSVQWRHVGIVVFLSVIALAYTTPWDNYLIYKNVWSYGPDRVVGTVGWVPVEEYLFFLLQPIFSGLWLLWMLHLLPPRNVPARGVTGRRIGTVVGICLTIAGVFCLTRESSLYMGLILVWAGPVLAGQWFLAGEKFLNSACLVGIAVPTIYLWIADGIAINQSIWSISSRYTVGLAPLGLPVEEALFFLVTNVLVVQGILMFHPLRPPDVHQERSTTQNRSYS